MIQNGFLHGSQAGAIECELAFAPNREAAFASADLRERLDEAIKERSTGRPILSLDVFDTLLTRDATSELRRFVEIGAAYQEIIHAAYPDVQLGALDGFLARSMGTDATYRLRPTVDGCREGSLTEIIRVACTMLLGQAPDEICNQLRQAELDYEATKLSVSAYWLDKVQAHKARGGQCILVSDMYMHASDIAELLALLSVDVDLFDHVFSSADTSLPKHAGAMFGHVERALGASADDFFHVGDALVGDYRMAREAGWSALHCPIPEAEMQLRIQDHDAMEAHLLSEFGYQARVARPAGLFA